MRTSVAVMALWLMAAPLSAQTTDDRPTLQVGPVQIRPRLIFNNIGVDNNVFNERDNPKRDFTATTSPDVEVAVNPGRFRLLYTGAADFVYFKKYSSERSVNRSLAGRAEIDLNRLKPWASVGVTSTNARSNAEVDIRGRHHPRTYGTGSLFQLTPKTSVGAAVRRAVESYDEGTLFRGVDLSTTLNNRTTSYETSLALQLTSLTTFSLIVSDEQMRFPRSPLRDSDSIRIAPTVTFSPLGVLNGAATVGYRRFNGRDPLLADYSGLVATGSLGTAILDRFKVDTSFSRDVKYSYEVALPYYVSTSLRATVATLLAGGVDVRLSAGREVMGYRALVGQDEPGRDLATTYGGGVGYRVARHALVVVQADFIDRRSARDPSREFKNHRIFGTLSWGATTR